MGSQGLKVLFALVILALIVIAMRNGQTFSGEWGWSVVSVLAMLAIVRSLFFSVLMKAARRDRVLFLSFLLQTALYLSILVALATDLRNGVGGRPERMIAYITTAVLVPWIAFRIYLMVRFYPKVESQKLRGQMPNA